MAIVLVSHPILRKLYDLFWRSNTYTQVRTTPGDNRGLTQGLSASAVADARKEQRISFDLYFAITFITALHGVSALKVLLILYVNFKIATDLPRKYVPAFTWIFNIAILFANELSHGYAFEKIAVMLSPSQNLSMGNELALVNWGKKIDGYGGIIPRWEVLFKITVLRLISFNFDYYWSLNQRGSSSLEVAHFFSSSSRSISLTPQRRNSSIPPPYPNATASLSQPSRSTIHSVITLLTPYTPPSTLLAPS